MAPMIAGIQPLMEKLSNIFAAIFKTMAFTTKVKSPKERIFTGSVRRRRIGLKVMFKSPTTALMTKALLKLVTTKSSTIFEVTKMAVLERIHVKSNSILFPAALFKFLFTTTGTFLIAADFRRLPDNGRKSMRMITVRAMDVTRDIVGM